MSAQEGGKKKTIGVRGKRKRKGEDVRTSEGGCGNKKMEEGIKSSNRPLKKKGKKNPTSKKTGQKKHGVRKRKVTGSKRGRLGITDTVRKGGKKG